MARKKKETLKENDIVTVKPSGKLISFLINGMVENGIPGMIMKGKSKDADGNDTSVYVLQGSYNFVGLLDDLQKTETIEKMPQEKIDELQKKLDEQQAKEGN